MAVQTLFIAYAHRNIKWQELLTIHLKALSWASEIEVWSDQDIKGGDEWLDEIEQAISRSKVALLLISADFLASKFIRDEEIPRLLQRYRNDGLIVIPVLAHHCAWETVPWLSKMQMLPRNDRALTDHSPRSSKCDKVLADITKEVSQHLVDGMADGGAYQPLHPQISTSIHRPSPLEGHKYLPPARSLPLPCFFPSISSAAKSTLTPLDHLKIIVGLQYPCFLASVYDFAKVSREERLQMTALIDQAINKDQVVLLDSGIYEKKWSSNSNWSKSEFFSTLKSIPCHFGFYYDDVKHKSTIKETAISIASWVKNDRRKAEIANLFPIIHDDGKSHLEADKLPLEELCQEVVNVLDPDIIAVAERELGEGILAGAKKMIQIRKAVDAIKPNVRIHLLGTGNPMSILVYSACGVDSFDGLDWCQTIVDYKERRLYHNQHLDFFLEQSNFAADDKMNYSTRMLGHNLTFYLTWMEEIRESLANGTLSDLLRSTLPPQFYTEFECLLD